MTGRTPEPLLPEPLPPVLDVLVIGAGQAGLAMGHVLARRKHRFAIVDAAAPGDSWRARWDSLRLFTPARYCGLPGMAFPGDPDHHPGKDEVADYLVRYADAFGLPVTPHSPVTGLTRADGCFTAVTGGGGVWRARQVVIATGPFQEPWRPAAAEDLDPEVVSVHSAHYRNPAALPGTEVLVVGAGNSGAQIAAELAVRGRRVSVAGPMLPYLPQRLLGRDAFWWFDRLGLLRTDADTRLGRRLSGRETLFGTNLRAMAKAGALRLVPRVTGAKGRRITLADGTVLEPDAVVWATGYRHRLPWLTVPVLDERGAPVHRRGVGPVPGLYFLGQPWQTHRASALLAGVGRDAALIARHLAAGHQAASAAPSGPIAASGPGGISGTARTSGPAGPGKPTGSGDAVRGGTV
ncbi:NAD(P)/FAD-dependent oxidoreductase [Streptomyces sp. MST-110588]|uniref:flavin-containing monooxygenase n=1 Tax=Streptomyces sp. MST-110588 TaxID=2833628 RepID=UPI001F5C2737|nr:NAD(P)/FAD-dependent oxidoreductase [Streptomyces sp. MST-110588]UNO38512.1 NAD(P)-binding domain-containing protein [Streptomyces sp. MST-110588]